MPCFLLRPAFAPRNWLAVARMSSDERSAHRSWQFPPVKGFSAGENHPKRSSPPTTAASPEFDRQPRTLLRLTFAPRSWLADATLFSDEHPAHRSWQFPPVKGFLAGGNPPKRRSPPTTAASPEFDRRTTHPPPANIPPPKLNYPAPHQLRRAPASSEFTRPLGISKIILFLEHTEKTDGICSIGLKNIALDRLSD